MLIAWKMTEPAAGEKKFRFSEKWYPHFGREKRLLV